MGWLDNLQEEVKAGKKINVSGSLKKSASKAGLMVGRHFLGHDSGYWTIDVLTPNPDAAKLAAWTKAVEKEQGWKFDMAQTDKLNAALGSGHVLAWKE